MSVVIGNTFQNGIKWKKFNSLFYIFFSSKISINIYLIKNSIGDTTMRLMGEGKNKSRVGVSIWDRQHNKTKDGRKSITFTVEDTTMEEMENFIKDAIRKAP